MMVAAVNPAFVITTSLNDNDVLLGRGIGPSYFIGNKRMAKLVESRKEEYNSIRSYKKKISIKLLFCSL